MRLKKEEIQRLARRIAGALKERNLASFKKGEEAILARIEASFAKNLEEEAAVEDQVKKLMEQYRAQVASGAVDPQRVYQMIKRQVAKDRKFIL